ncbi:hypothetical protein SUGI_0936850 [Cryptomeria japonica]|nr:hypothetical protein SUGI_0936850 [Cryptomeria japonica]
MPEVEKSLHFRHYCVSLHGISVRILILHVQMLIEMEIQSEENGSLVDDPVADDCDPNPFINYRTAAADPVESVEGEVEEEEKEEVESVGPG